MWPSPKGAAVQSEALPIRLRAQATPEGALVRVQMRHDMETGQRRNERGERVPLRHIRTVTVWLDDAVVLRAQWGPGVARDPFMQLLLPTAKAGDTVRLRWEDTQGDNRTAETRVS